MVSQRVVTVHAPGPCLLILISVQYACCTEKSLTHSVQSCTVGQQRDTSQVVCARAPGFLLVVLLYEFFLQTLSMKTTDSTRQNEQGLRERNDHAAAAMMSA